MMNPTLGIVFAILIAIVEDLIIIGVAILVCAIIWNLIREPQA